MNLVARSVLALSVALFVSANAAATSAKWLTSFDAAVKQSQKTGKPILADFTGSDWCSWCMRLHQEVFDTPEFKKWADKNVVLLELDYPQHTALAPALKQQNDKLMHRYGYCVKGFPTILFLRADGFAFGQFGYARGGPTTWTALADRLVHPKKTAANGSPSRS